MMESLWYLCVTQWPTKIQGGIKSGNLLGLKQVECVVLFFVDKFFVDKCDIIILS